MDRKFKEPIFENEIENNYVIDNFPKEKKKVLNRKKKQIIMNDPQSEYMKDYYKKMIETENLKRYIRSKKKEKNKLNIEILHMYDSDIEKIRNANNLERVTYETNYKVAGPHYVGADKQLYELCRKRNLITLPKKYIEYQKYLEDSLEKENKITPTVKDIIKDENKENEVKPINEEKKNVPNITKGPRFKKSRKEFKSFENNYIIDEKTLDLKYNSNNSVQKFSYLKPKRKSAPIQTYLGSNSGYNALCQPAIDKCLIQRHNTHRNKEKFNIEQVIYQKNLNKIFLLKIILFYIYLLILIFFLLLLLLLFNFKNNT